MKVNVNLINGIAYVTENWKDVRGMVAKHCLSEWESRGIADYMMNGYINVDEPITRRFYDLDAANQAIVCRALEKVSGCADQIIEY